jgi:hypothetical protein
MLCSITHHLYICGSKYIKSAGIGIIFFLNAEERGGKRRGREGRDIFHLLK